MLRSAERQFEIVGQALGQLGRAEPDLAARVPDLPRIVAFRNVIIHGYAAIDDRLVWEVATERTAPLVAVLDDLLDSGIMSDAKAIVDKLWNYCNILRDDGLSYGDYVEQLTYLLFLKMAEEQHQFGFDRIVPQGYDWPSLLGLKGEALEAHYIAILNQLGRGEDMLGVVFRKAQNRIQDPAKLERLIKDLIGNEQWMTLDADVKGDAYEGLLEKNAADTKSGAGQYFTPRALISAMVDVMQPGPDMRICDPACGTGGFFLAAFDHVLRHNPNLDPDQKRHLRSGLFTGWEIVDNTARLCAMNLLLHGIESPDSDSPVHVDDALRADPGERFDMVLTNPPFGKKSSVQIVNSAGKAERQSLTVVRDDFWASTSNKQLNFVQHVKTLLKVGGRAAVVVPDNVLFEGGAGETIRRRLLHECDVHTLLRLPTGIFYAQGVKANVLFFDRKPGSDTPWTKRPVDLRPADQQALHPQDEHAHPRRPRRLRRVLRARAARQAGGERAVPLLQLRRAGRPRQGQPRHLLAPRREPGRHR